MVGGERKGKGRRCHSLLKAVRGYMGGWGRTDPMRGPQEGGPSLYKSGMLGRTPSVPYRMGDREDFLY